MAAPLVLCYHALSDSFPAALSTTPARFERQLRLLRRAGYRGVTFSQALAQARPRTVAVTFDDAYRSVIELALPILQGLGWPATVFAPTDFIGSDEAMRWPGIERWLSTPHERELLPMSWEQLRALAGAGWEIGSHSCSHPHLTACSDAGLRDELESSRERLAEGMRAPCLTIAYPYGDVDDRVVTAARAAGYRQAAALPRLPRGRSALRWPRVGVYGKDGTARFALKCAANLAGLRLS